jgi:hypothetical protein
MKLQPIIVSLSPEAIGLLADNGLDLLTVLRQQGVEVQRGEWPEDGPPRESGTKSTELVILASAAAAPMIAVAIARIFDAIGRNRRPVVMERKYEPALDAEGQPIRDADGNPVMKWTETEKPASAPTETTQAQPVEYATGISLLGLKVELKDKYEQLE